MLEKAVVRRLFLVNRTALQRTILQTPAQYGRSQSFQRYSTSLPNIAQASFWESMIPKPLRRSNRLKSRKAKSAGWNPATFYIVILLLIGSMSIQMITLRNEFAAFMRRSDAKIDILREVIEKVQKGEEVDVEGLLGTGDPKKEQEWEDVLKEIEEEDQLWEEMRKKKPRRRSAPQSIEPIEVAGTESVKTVAENAKPKTTSNAPRGFY